MNKSDSERMATVLENNGYKKALNFNEANLVVVNMCSVRQSAVDRIFGLGQKFKEQRTKNKKQKTILTGCILKKDRKKFAEKFDFILNVEDLPYWSKTLNLDNQLVKTDDYFKINPKYSNKFSASIPIMTGCNNFCAYCIVPYTRGREISRPTKEIICEVKNLIKQDCKEIWLLGQNVNSYNNEQRTENKEQKINFPKLLKLINYIPGNFWIRFTSSHPKDFSDELIEAIVECKKVTEYLNLPVQSGNNEILKKMNRSYTISHYKKLVKKIRKKIPDITLSTDVIVGFPNETKKQFEDTVKLFKEIKFDMAYISKYSLRPGTAAAELKDNVPQKEKDRREKVLTEILKETALGNNKKYIGKKIEVLVEKHKNSFLIGKSWHYKTVKFKGPKKLIGQFVKVKIIDALSWGLKGKIV